MHERRVRKMVDDIFYDIVETDEVQEQKEELCTHLHERVQEYTAQGMDVDDALQKAKASLGDPQELVSGFPRKKAVEWHDIGDDVGVNVRFRIGRLIGLRVSTLFVSLSPFIYVLLGVTQGFWGHILPDGTWSWWAWGWVIIPVAGILCGGIGLYLLPALSPFIYFLLGAFQHVWLPETLPNWWLWGWLIIPIFGILFAPFKRRKKWKRRMSRMEILDGDNVRVWSGGKSVEINGGEVRIWKNERKEDEQ